jgi:hypothetical protein
MAAASDGKNILTKVLMDMGEIHPKTLAFLALYVLVYTVMPPLSVGNTFQELSPLREPADNT